MKAIKFKEANLTIAEVQDEYETLEVLHDGETAISCWMLTERELAEVARTGVIYVSQLTGMGPVQPISIFGVKGDIIEKE